MTELIQIRLAIKDNLQFQEQEKTKTDKKLAEDTLGKFSIDPLKDAVDFKLRGETVQSIKIHTA